MRRGSLVLMITLLICTGGGCGTMFNVTGHEVWLLNIEPERPIVPFGGVGNDVRWMSRGFAPDSSAPLATIAAAVDLPLSFVGDIITLPWTAYQSLIVVQKHPESAFIAGKGNGSIPQDGAVQRGYFPPRQDAPPVAKDAETDSICAKFRLIRNGMTRHTVQAILGRAPDQILLPGGTLGGEWCLWTEGNVIITVETDVGGGVTS